MAKQQREKIYSVNPLKTRKDIQSMRASLREQGTDRFTTNRTGKRNEMLFTFGINAGLRVSDIVKLRVKDVADKDRVNVIEIKTGKKRKVYLANIKKELSKYIRDMKLQPDDYLFPSRKHGHHISTTQVYRALVQAGKSIGRDDIGTHTMRKTFGYWFIKQGHSIEQLMVIFNHSSESITKRYIGIEQEELEDSLKDFRL